MSLKRKAMDIALSSAKINITDFSMMETGLLRNMFKKIGVKIRR